MAYTLFSIGISMHCGFYGGRIVVPAVTSHIIKPT